MRVSVPFVYQVHYKPPRQPSYRSSKIACSAEVEIVEFDGVEAPVIHVVSDASLPTGSYHSDKTTSKFHVPGGDCVIRMVGGQHYASRFPVEDIHLYRGKAEFDPFACEVELPYGLSEFQKTKLDLSYGRSDHASLREFDDATGVVRKFTSERDLWERHILELAGRFAVVDGVLYEKVHEPVLSLVDGGNGSIALFVEEAVSPGLDRFFKGEWRGHGSDRTRFGLDEYDRAVTTARERADKRKCQLELHASVSTVSPGRVTFRGDHEYLYMAAKGAAEGLSKAIRFLPEDVGIAVSEAANLLATHDRLTIRAVAAARRMCSLLEEYLRDGYSPAPDYIYDGDAYHRREAFKGIEGKVARLADAIRHWDARDDVGLEWLAVSMDALPVFEYPNRAFEITSSFDLEKIAMKWKGDLPPALRHFDPETSAIVVVQDFEELAPIAAVVYDRNDPGMPAAAFGNPDDDTIGSAIALADAFVGGARVEAGLSLGAGVSRPSP